MTLRVITGPANAGKTGRVYALVRSVSASGGSGIVALPTIPDVERARAELSHDAPLGVRITTLAGLTTGLWDQEGDGRTIVSDEHRSVACAAIARARGSSRAMGRLAADCAVQLAEQSGEGWRREAHRIRGPGSSLADLLVDYAGYLARAHLLEAAEARSLLAHVQLRGIDLLVAHRFSDLSPSHVRLLTGAAASTQVVVTLAWSPELRATAALDALVGELAAAGELQLVGGTETRPEPSLEQLGRHLFSAPRALAADGAVRFVLAEGGEAEARQIAAEVLRALDEGAAGSPERVAVAFRDPQRHYSVLSHVFEEAGIAADYDVPTPLRRTGFGAAALDLIGFALTASRARLLNVLRSPFSGIDLSVERELEERWRSRGVVSESALLGDLSRYDRGLADAVRDARGMASGALTVRDCARLSELLSTMFGARYAGRYTFGDRHAELDARAEASIMRLLGELAATPEAPVLLEDVRAELESATIVPSVLERPGRVQVMPVSRLRGRRFDTVILGGLNGGEFPAPSPETTLPGSAVAEVLTGFGGDGGPGNGPAFEQMLFYEAVTRARNRLVVSAQTTDSDGDALLVSPLFESVADFFRDAEGDIPSTLLARRRIDGESPPPNTPFAREALRLEAADVRSADPRAQAARRRARGRPGMLTDPGSIGIDPQAALSASQIETYLRCPYRWFYERAVGPNELERAFDMRDEGSFAHLLLARTYEALIGGGDVPLVPEGLERALSVLEDVHAELCAEAGPVRVLEEQVGRSHARQWARRILAEDSEHADRFVPTHLEWGFGFEDDPVDLGEFSLRGRIDRIDLDESGRAIVTDYKRTCGSHLAAAKILADGKVQVALYLEVVRRRLGVEPIAGLYRGLATRGERGLVLAGALEECRTTSTDLRDGAAFDQLVGDALTIAASAVAGMRAGQIAPAPRSPKSCSQCPARRVCGAAL